MAIIHNPTARETFSTSCVPWEPPAWEELRSIPRGSIWPAWITCDQFICPPHQTSTCAPRSPQIARDIAIVTVQPRLVQLFLHHHGHLYDGLASFSSWSLFLVNVANSGNCDWSVFVRFCICELSLKRSRQVEAGAANWGNWGGSHSGHQRSLGVAKLEKTRKIERG